MENHSRDIKYESIVRILQGTEGVLEFKGEMKAKCE